MSQDKKNEPKIPKPVTQQSLRNAALRYIDRFATSRDNLRKVLMRRVQKSHYHHGTDLELASQWIEELLDKLEKSQFINDQTYADMRAGSLHRRGTSQRILKMKLKEKGLSEDTITKALETLSAENESENLERDAAIALAKRRRLGPWRLPEKRSDTKDKDLASLARAGFSYDLAKEIIEAESVADLED
jgi:regulatory protein